MAGRILIVFDGTRGDTQPYLLAGKALMKAGFDVMVTGPGDAGRMAQDFEVPFVRTRLSAQKVFADPEMAKEFATDDLSKVLASAEKKRDEFLTEGSKQKDLEALCNLFQEWKPDLVLAGLVTLGLAIMISKVHKVPVVSFTLQHGRVCKTLKPMYMPKWLPKFTWRRVWTVFAFLLARSEFRQSGSAMSKILGVPKAQLHLTANDIVRYYAADATFLSIIGTSAVVHGHLPEDFNGNWLVVWNIFYFSINLGNFIIPTDELIFFRGVGQAPTRQ